MDVPKVLSLVDGFLSREGRSYALAGAVALHAYGFSRATGDLDVVVDAEAREGLIRFLEEKGFETLSRSDGYSNHLHPDPTLGRLDCIYVEGETARRLFEGARTIGRYGPLTVAVPRPEHLAAMKAFAMRNDPTRALRDMADIQSLLELPGVDRDEVRLYFEKYGLEEIYRDIAARAGPARP